jgi:site-specific DNA recombinase|nr:recombinase family protein [uncultured Lachnoclostridium sp.]
MNIAIYSRKSVFSDKSDSTESQIKIGKEYALSNYDNINNIIEYQDEGFSGSNTNRPGFTQLMDDILEKKIDVLICYKIDRISRNVLDFSRTFNVLQEHGVQFVSVKEQIDTSTPLGRAMMYICSVFAQMERETIAERVKDSSIELAKSGKWPGGQPPIGYMREKIIVSGKTHTTLVPNPDEIPFLNLIYDKFLEGYTLGGLETYFRKHEIKTLNNNYLSSAQIHSILKSPHCVEATPDIYNYFKDKGCIMVSEIDKYDGTHGLLVYGRTNGGKKKTHSNNPPEKWMVSIGLHKPLISSSKWLTVQAQFGRNKIDKTRKHEVGLLKGIIKCKCGYAIRVQHKVDKVYNKIYDNYYCSNRNRRGIDFCDLKMVRVEELDGLILSILKEISIDENVLSRYINQTNKTPDYERSKTTIINEVKSVERKIRNLTISLQENIASSASKYIISEIEKLDKQLTELNSELREVTLHEKNKIKSVNDLHYISSKIKSYMQNFDTLLYSEKTKFLQEIIKDCVWDGENLFVSF